MLKVDCLGRSGSGRSNSAKTDGDSGIKLPQWKEVVV